MANFISFDLEVPLSPQDNAYELMKLFLNEGTIFGVINRNDDLLTLENRRDDVPYNTSTLIAPFLIPHNISESDITNLSIAASFTGVTVNLISSLQANTCNVFCITTTYRQYVLHHIYKLGIYSYNIASTTFPLDKLDIPLCKESTEPLRKAQK
ncbi:hypothetical protein ACFLT8_03210 [Chloroflexota bacterium]